MTRRTTMSIHEALAAARTKRERKALRKAAAQGITTIVDGVSIEDAPTEVLIAAFATAPAGRGMKHYLAWLLNERGALQGCGCDVCTDIRAHAVRWQRHLAHLAAHPDAGAP